MATHSSILAWGIPWTRSLVGYSPWGHRVGHERETNTFTFSVSSSLHCLPKPPLPPSWVLH